MPVPASSGGGRGCVVPRITFIHPQGLSGEVAPNTSILQAAEALGFPLPHDCGGNASCTTRSEEHTSELQSLAYLVCRLLLEKKKDPVHDQHARPTHLL